MTSIEAHVQQPYKYGFATAIESEVVPAGLNEDVIRLISDKKGEPAWMLDWRLKAYRNWLKMSEPHWPNVKDGPIDYQAISYYHAPPQPRCIRSGRSQAGRDLRETGNSDRGAEASQRRGRRCGLRQRLGRDDISGGAREVRRHLLSDVAGDPRASRTRPEVPR